MDGGKNKIKYPDVNDADFYKFINKEYDEYKVPKTKKTLKEICFPSQYQFQLPQKFLAEFINPNTPYRGILIYHRIGAGKTCTAIKIAENFKGKKNILIVLPASLKGNFRGELRSLCAGNNYLSNSDRSKLKTLDPQTDEYKHIIKQSDNKINKFYNILSYNKFAEMIKSKDIDMNNTLLIIDEVHNMISETGTYYELLYKILKKAPNTSRIVLMSATPMFDKPMEIALTLNLLPLNKKVPIGMDFVKTFIKTKEQKSGNLYTVKNMDKFKKLIRGYVSYFRGAPPHVFPTQNLFLTKCKMSDFQYEMYMKTIDSEKMVVDDYINEDIPNSFFIGSRMISNIAFPNGEMNELGYESLNDDNIKMSELKQYSPKFYQIMKKIKKCEGTVFIYSNFKEYGGIKSFVKILERQRFKNYDEHGKGPKRFAIWSGDQNPQYKEEIKSIFNSINNKDGSDIKIILGSPSIKEGVSLLRVREVHILEPYWNMSRLDQVIGRAIRFCSHKDVKLDLQFVDVYIYLSTHPNIETTIDQHIMQMALSKQNIVKEFEKAIKEASIDCTLFYNANNYKDEDPINCVV
ncbi:MAG: Acanthamoeba polyphaga mimivirus [Bacteroidota bacterium]|jgi:superfamily II DNA or RNA helicase